MPRSRACSSRCACAPSSPWTIWNWCATGGWCDPSLRAERVDHGEFTGSIALKDSGWCVVRASSDAGRYPVLDTYVYATTSPIYVSVAGRRPRSPEDARYFAAWVDRMTETTAAYPDWNSAAEKAGVLNRLAQARAVFAGQE